MAGQGIIGVWEDLSRDGLVHAIPCNRTVPIEEVYIFKSIAIKKKISGVQ